MISQKDLIIAFSDLSSKLDQTNQDLIDTINQTFANNSWLTPENYWKSIHHWKNSLSKANIEDFISKYSVAQNPKIIGIIMAGNIPMVGFHDLLCVVLMGHKAQVKLSSDDPYVIAYFVSVLKSINSNLKDRIIISEKLQSVDAVIATGSNNSYRYFESYFKHLPRLLRKNRKSIAILNGTETEKDLQLLAYDILTYFGLGCRNVSQIFIPNNQSVEKVLDAMMSLNDVINHHKYANNYTYHKALLLMNNEQHLDTGFLLPKKRRNLSAPLACIHYDYYDSMEDIKAFIQENKEDIQCIVGNYSSTNVVPFGKAQSPDLKDFADNIDTLEFLSTLETA
jgi:hypothetical protein